MSYQEQLATQYAETRARLLGRPPARPKAMPLEMPEESVIVALPVQRPPAPPTPLNPPRTGPVPNWLRIALEVSEKHGVSLDDMKSVNRAKRLVAARYEAFYRIRTETTLSYPQIGRRFGGRDHTTVLHGVQKYTSERPNLPPDELRRLKWRANRLSTSLAAVEQRIAQIEGGA